MSGCCVSRFYLMRPILAVGLALSAALAGPRGEASSRDFSKVTCPTPDALAEEILLAQVAGLWLSSSNEECLDPARFPHISLLRPSTESESDGPLRVHVADETKPFEIKSVKKHEFNSYWVEFVFNVIEKGKRVSLQDKMRIDVYSGTAKQDYGCAAVVIPPSRYAVKASCRFNKKK